MTTPSRDAVRVRFAPSPTGLLHIGGLRTALYNYLLARKLGGAYVLRIEDTDRERFVEEAEADILASLEWAGIGHDEGPDVGGPHEPYAQSRRKQYYEQYVGVLLERGLAYYAFDTKEEIEAMRQRLATPENPTPKYDMTTRMQMRNSLSLPPEEVERLLAEDHERVVRLKVPQGKTIVFDDLVRGPVSFETDAVDDQVLLKSDGLPTYHLANVVDDHLMGITHVIRGEEWLPSTPKHIMLYRFLGWEPPKTAHLPLILSPTGGKLSKRNADKMGIPVSVQQYREEGYEPEALVNFLAFLGWNPGTEEELFSLEELVEAFSLERVGSHAVQFNLDKLRWYNQQHIKRLGAEEIARRAMPILQEAGFDPKESFLRQVAGLMAERLTFIRDLATEGAYFFRDPMTYDPAGLKKRWKADSAELVALYADRMEHCQANEDCDFTADFAERILREVAEERGVGAGRIIHPTRLALSGVTHGPGLFEMMELFGLDECLERMRRAVEKLGTPAATA